LKSKKNVFALDLGFSGSDVTMWACFGNQLPFQDKLWPQAITRQQIELESCSNPVMTSGVV